MSDKKTESHAIRRLIDYEDSVYKKAFLEGFISFNFFQSFAIFLPLTIFPDLPIGIVSTFQFKVRTKLQ